MAQRGFLVGDRTVLLVVDVQERFRTAIANFPAVVAASCRLVRSFRLLDRPVLVTEQYPKGLGPTVEELRDALHVPSSWEAPVIEKTAFSACGAPGLMARLSDLGCRSILVCGIEAHVCVGQSVGDLLDAGYAVHVAVDAVGSRREGDRETALRRLETAGAILTTSEMAVFELLRDAKHPRFKEVQALFK
jgi:nicotinamidase-related amidase